MTKYGKKLALLSVSDLVLTFTGMHYGFFNEGSGINERIMTQYGIVAFSVYHLFFAAFGIVLLESLWRTQPERQPTWRRCYLFINYMYVVVFCSMMIIQPLYYAVV